MLNMTLPDFLRKLLDNLRATYIHDQERIKEDAAKTKALEDIKARNTKQPLTIKTDICVSSPKRRRSNAFSTPSPTATGPKA